MHRPPGVIVLAVYRPDASLLKTQLQSIIGQSFKDWQCIVGIDGTDPQTASLLRETIGVDTRFSVMEFPENVGIYRHFERLLTKVEAGAPWIALADQDDRWHNGKLETLVAVLVAQGVSGVSCQARLVTHLGTELGRTHRRAKPLTSLLLVNEVTGCLSIFKSEVMTTALPFPPASRLARHDHWLGLCSMSMQGFHFTDYVLHDYVQHRGNAIGERRIPRIASALADVLFGRASWDELTSSPWEWRITVALALNSRFTLQEKEEIALIARGKMTARLLRLLLRQTSSGHIPARAAAALAFAALRR